ncbi:MAG: hypothetical protein ACLTGN_07070 [Clostridium sp.]
MAFVVQGTANRLYYGGKRGKIDKSSAPLTEYGFENKRAGEDDARTKLVQAEKGVTWIERK